MEREQLMGLYLRLQRELVEAYTAPTSSDGRIERLTDELAAIQRLFKAETQRDEQTSDATIPGALADPIDGGGSAERSVRGGSSGALSSGRP